MTCIVGGNISNIFSMFRFTVHFRFPSIHRYLDTQRIPGNTATDEAAKEAALLLPVPNLRVPMTDFKTALESS